MMWIVEYFIPFVLILTVLVFVHEWGHFWVARRKGVRVTTFSIGFGPELFGWTDKHQTRWRVSLIPLGGYVKFLGDADASSTTVSDADLKDEERGFTLHSKTPLQRMAVAVAGPAANFIFALVLLTTLISIKGVPVLPPTIGDVKPNMKAAQAGLMAGDKVIAVGEEKITDFTNLRKKIQPYVGKDLTLDIERDGKTLKKTIPLYEIDPKTSEHKPVGVLGIVPGAPEYVKTNIFKAAYYSVVITWNLCVDTLRGIGLMITGQRGAGELGGILAIGDMASQSAKSGLFTIIEFMAILSINLGFINLFPIPVLDGGHILLCSIEYVRGKPLSEKIIERAFLFGFMIVIALMLFAMWNDLVRYDVFGSVSNLIGKIKGLF